MSYCYGAVHKVYDWETTAMKLRKTREVIAIEMCLMTRKKVSIHLETTHHFCLKRIQNLPRSTRSDMMKGMLGFTSTQTYTYMQTLLFLGSLCRLQPEDTCFQLFIHRLYQQCTSTTNFSKGLITDIVFILHKYGLYYYFSIE